MFVTHEIEVGQRHGNRLCTDTKKSADFDNRLASGTRVMTMIDRADLVIIYRNRSHLPK